MNNDPVYHRELHNSENMTESGNCPTEQRSIECETEVVPRKSEQVG